MTFGENTEKYNKIARQIENLRKKVDKLSLFPKEPTHELPNFLLSEVTSIEKASFQESNINQWRDFIN